MKQEWDKRFSIDEYFYGEGPNDFLKEKNDILKKGSKILSIGDGEGRNSVFLASKGHDVSALDMSLVGLEKTKKLAEKKNVKVTTIFNDLNHYKFEENSWEGVVSIFCHLPPELRVKVHKQIQESLKPGGIFLLEGYTKEQLDYGTGGPKSLEMFESKEELESSFSNFEILLSQEIKREIHEGIGHNGMSAVVQFIARKR